MVVAGHCRLLTEKLLGLFIRRRSPSAMQARLFCLALVTMISVPDYLSGIEISLSIFYLVPVVLATWWLGPAEGIGIVVLTTIVRVISDLLNTGFQPLPFRIWWNVSAGFLIFCFIVWVLNALVRLHRTLETQVESRTQELLASIADRDLLQHELLVAGARERSAIGRELHDELGQHLVATAMAAKVLARQLDSKPAQDAFAVVGWIEQAIAKSRKLARGLLLSQIDPERFPGELEELAAASTRGHIECRVTYQGEPPRISAEQCAQLFRIAQEAVSNALQHANPRSIQISLASDADAFHLVIQDDGRGLQPPGARAVAGIGVRIMEHRARLLGASFVILSEPDSGTRVICRLPLNPAANP